MVQWFRVLDMAGDLVFILIAIVAIFLTGFFCGALVNTKE